MRSLTLVKYAIAAFFGGCIGEYSSHPHNWLLMIAACLAYVRSMLAEFS